MTFFQGPRQDGPDDNVAPRSGLLGVGLGAGLLGAVMIGLRCIIRPATKARIPETISPLVFRSHAFQSSRGGMIYHESGGGPLPTLVFIHDLDVGASSYEWSKVYPEFAERRRVLAPDLIGFGESERPRTKLTAVDYAASLAEFIEAHCGEDAQRPVVVASGLGAGFAVLMAAQHPELASRLILWMPTGKAGTSFRRNLASRIPTVNRFLYRNLLARRRIIRAGFAKRCSAGAKKISHEAVEVYALCAQQYQAEYTIYRWLQRRLDLDFEERLAEVKLPIALLWAGSANGKSLDSAELLANVNRLCSLRIVEGAGPCALLESPQKVADALKEELQSELRVLKAAV
jgi:pimeloyl-ACP methyl ester carboxylesterase